MVLVTLFATLLFLYGTLLPPMALCQRQKSSGKDEKQERVRGMGLALPNLGKLDTISITPLVF